MQLYHRKVESANTDPAEKPGALLPIAQNTGLMKLFLRFASIIPIFFLAFGISFAQINLTLSKSNNAPNPVPSGQPFTYTLTYSWSGGAPGTLYIIDNVPATLDVISALPGSPISSIVGNQVTFTLTGLTMPSGSGTVQVNVRFKPGVTCAGVRACNKAVITVNPNSGAGVTSNEDCATSATPVNRWTFEKEWLVGCAVDDEVIFRIKVINPSGNDIGGLNLTNISLTDIIPPGAIVTAVTGNWTGISGTNLTGGPTTLGVSPWTAWYIAYVHLKFPTPTFSSGQTAINRADLRFNTPCSPNFITLTDTAKVTLCQGLMQGSLGKYLSLSLYFPSNPSWYPVFAPGCCGTYSLYYTNSGTLSQSNFVMEDLVPSKVDVNAIRTNVPASNTPVTVEVYCWSGGICSPTPSLTQVYTTAGLQTLTGLPANICKVKWSYSNTITILQSVYNYLDVCVRNTDYTNGSPVLTGQNIINTVTASATGLPLITATHTKVVDAIQPKVIATKLFIGGCNSSCNINPAGPFQPGDTVRFRMAVANIGNQSATTCSINDILPAGLSYVGNETYFYGTFNWMVYQYNPPCCSLNVVVPTQIGGALTKPVAGATNLTWTFPTLPGRCDGLVDYFIIDFDVKISDNPPAPAGQYANTFSIAASNITTVPSNQAFLTVNSTAQLQVIKEVKKVGSGAPWASSASLIPGGSGQFKLTVKNTGNTPLSQLCLLDIMPWAGDIKVLPPYLTRGSMFDLPYNPANGPFAITPAGFSASYNTLGLIQSKNPTRSTECGGFCGVADPAGALAGSFVPGASNTYSFKINAGPGVNLAPGASLDILVPFKLPTQNIKPQYNACNSFGVQAKPLGMPSVCLSAESNNACVQVIEEIPCFKLVEYKLNCVGKNDNGAWVYQLVFNLTNLSGQNGFIQVVPSAGGITNLTPTTLPNNVPTPFTATYVASSTNQTPCFTITLYDLKQNRLCDTTFCLDLLPCPDPCPCPFKIMIDKPTASPASGSSVLVNGWLSVVGTNVLKVKATIVSSSITQTCKFGGTTTYTPAATFQSTTWNPGMVNGLGTSEVSWSNMLCPQLQGKQIGLYLNVPNAPSKMCYQVVRICIRYTITDCKCNTCDTLVCYEFVRKWKPFDPIDFGTGTGAGKGGIFKSDGLLAADQPFAAISLSGSDKGVLTINNPGEDEFTTGVKIISIKMSASPGIKIKNMKPDNQNWTEGLVMINGVVSTGELTGGSAIKFDVNYDNSQAFKSWVNHLEFKYLLEGIPDTLVGWESVSVRTPGAVGGDLLVSETPGAKITNARTFALAFKNANLTKDSIAKVLIKLKKGSILAVGPYLSTTEVPMKGYKTGSGSLVLLTSTPEASEANASSIPGGGIISPIFITIASDDPTNATIDYQTQTEAGDVITEGSLILNTPINGIKGDGAELDASQVWLYDAVPNPTNGNTNIKFDLKNFESEVSLFISDLNGIERATLIQSKALNGGEHNVDFDTKALPSGVYYYTIKAGGAVQTRKLIVVK